MVIKKSVKELFPEGFDPYPGQEKAMESIIEAINNGYKYIFLDAPTGSGKSVIARALGNATRDPDPHYVEKIQDYSGFKKDGMPSYTPHGAFALTTTKQLQHQYSDTFQNVPSLKGKSNYQCNIAEEFTVDVAPCLLSTRQREECWASNICTYYSRRNSVLVNTFSVLNYNMFFHLPDDLKQREMIISDEASELEQVIVSNYSCEINYKKLKIADVDIQPLKNDSTEHARIWLRELELVLSSKIKAILEDGLGVNKLMSAKMTFLQNLNHSVSIVNQTWGFAEYIIERTRDGVTFVPYKINKLTGCLFDFADTHIMMSATFVGIKKNAEILGIKEGEYKYIKLPSSFDPKKSPIYCSGQYPLSKKTMGNLLPKVVKQVKDIVDSKKGQKGLIHTHSFEITKAVQKVLYGKRFLYREDGSNNETIIKEHFMRTDDTVIISPSLTMGLDLKGDLGRWQIIMKLPYPPLGNKRIQKLFRNDPEWYAIQMLKVLVQACGRCTRSEDDWSDTYILDGNIVRALKMHRKLLPQHFLDRIV